MKAILRMIPGGKGNQTRVTKDRLVYCFLSSKNGGLGGSDRVAWIGGDLDGYGHPIRDGKLMAQAMDCGHEHLPGRRTRHAVLSCEPGSDPDEAVQKLIQSAPLLAKKLGATRWIAVVHMDTDKPHLHLIYANADRDLGRRLDLRPDYLSEMQGMEWTPYLDSGRGERGKDRGARGKLIAAGAERKEAERAQKKRAASDQLRAFLNSRKVPKMGEQELAEWLHDCPDLPDGWETKKLKTKAGNNPANPAIIIDGEGLRLRRFLEHVRTPTTKTKKEKEVPI